jgi:diadenosine tetraphosphate (Ap4A) HIT family hydrolase
MTRDFLGHEWTYNCLGCAIADGSMQPPGGLIKLTDHFCVHQDPLIPLPGFLVIGARRHIRSMAEMDEPEYQEFAALLRETGLAIHAATGVEHLTIVQEEHSVHFHLWFFPWTAEVVEKYGPPALDKIRAIMAGTRQQVIGQAEWEALAASIEKIKVNCRASHQV